LKVISLKLWIKVGDAFNICRSCDGSCDVGKCTVGNDSTKCKKCITSLFLNYTNSCVAANLCDSDINSTWKGIKLN